jgi:beta-1,4-mannosyl-glycoprotein beta-1,4-N-acetylglucosaminyltransferase
VFGFELSLSYFKLNYVNVAGPASKVVWTVATRKNKQSGHTFDELRMGIRDGSIPARIFQNSGWHFSYLSDDEGIRNKIRSFSHQELNTPEIMERVSVDLLLQQRADLFARPGFVWEVLGTDFLPDSVKSDLASHQDWLVTPSQESDE